MLKKKEFEEYLENALAANTVYRKTVELHYLTIICFELKHHVQTGIKLTEEILNIEPNNFNALWNQAKLCSSMAEPDFENLNKLGDELSTAVENEIGMFAAEIEIARIEDLFFRTFIQDKILPDFVGSPSYASSQRSKFLQHDIGSESSFSFTIHAVRKFQTWLYPK